MINQYAKEIDELIYKFYPKNILCLEEYFTTKEYLARRKVIKAAIEDKSLSSTWSELKQKINGLVVDHSQILADYSFAGGAPGLHLSFKPTSFGLPNNEVIFISLVVSVISKFWAYRFMDKSGMYFIPRYSPRTKKETRLLEKLDLLVKETFKDYQRLEAHYLTIEYEDVIIDYEESRNVFKLLFADHDN